MVHKVTQTTSTQSRDEETNNTLCWVGRWCFMDGSWKDKNLCSQIGWYSTLEEFERLMGTRNTRGSLSLLYSYMRNWSFHLGDGKHEKSRTISCDFCNRLFSAIKNGLGTWRMTWFYN